MEHVGAISEGVWNSLNEMSFEESEFMEQLLSSLSNEVPKCSKLLVSSTFWPYNHDQPNVNNYYSSDDTNSNSVYSLSSSYSGSILFPSSSHESFYNTHQISTGRDYHMMEDKNISSSRIHVLTTDNETEADEFLNQDVISIDSSSESNRNSLSQLGLIETETSMQETLKGDKRGDPHELSKKRSRNIYGEVHKNTRNIKTRRGSNIDDNDENINSVLGKNNKSSMCSEEISNDSHEACGVTSSSSTKACAGTVNLNGKMRANRGSATDPQSLYARKRRERINERLRILQNLVPNGTKVDISTMLEEAVQYVKFLQLQIKLLSSDDLWMYAPIAYNGMDIDGLDRLKISSTPKSQSS